MVEVRADQNHLTKIHCNDKARTPILSERKQCEPPTRPMHALIIHFPIFASLFDFTSLVGLRYPNYNLPMHAFTGSCSYLDVGVLIVAAVMSRVCLGAKMASFLAAVGVPSCI